MNGRVYDYNVGRFMSVDPVIQSPTNSQSLNPYSYIMNNPLAGTDPTGYSADKDVDNTVSDSGADVKSVSVKITATQNGETVQIATAIVDSNGAVTIQDMNGKEIDSYNIGAENTKNTSPMESRGFAGTFASSDASSSRRQFDSVAGDGNKAGFFEKALNFVTGNGFKSQKEVYEERAKKFGTEGGCAAEDSCFNTEYAELYAQYAASPLAAGSVSTVVTKTANAARLTGLRSSTPGPNFANHVKLVEHFKKHGGEFGVKSASQYLLLARETINKGIKIRYNYKGEMRTGFVRLIGYTKKKRELKFAFASFNNKGQIATFHTRSGKNFWKLINGNSKERVIHAVK